MPSILHQIPSDANIRREIKRIVFGKVLFCPHCHYSGVRKYKNRYRCKRCRKWFSFTSVTWLKGAKLPLQTIWLLLWAWLHKVALDQAVKLAGVSSVTARRWYEKFREHLPQDQLLDLRLSGKIQIDEAYRGKKENSYSIIGAKEIGSRKIVLEFLPKNSVDRREAVDFLSRYVVPGSNLFSDGAAIYRGIQNWWPVNHQFERHNRFQFTLTSEIEGLWGNYFTFVRRMYHHITFSKAPSMLNEFSLRFSCPEYFVSPARYLGVALKPIRRSRAKLWIIFLKKILETETIESPLVSKLKLVMPGARCL